MNKFPLCRTLQTAPTRRPVDYKISATQPFADTILTPSRKGPFHPVPQGQPPPALRKRKPCLSRASPLPVLECGRRDRSRGQMVSPRPTPAPSVTLARHLTLLPPRPMSAPRRMEPDTLYFPPSLRRNLAVTRSRLRRRCCSASVSGWMAVCSGENRSMVSWQRLATKRAPYCWCSTRISKDIR